MSYSNEKFYWTVGRSARYGWQIRRAPENEPENWALVVQFTNGDWIRDIKLEFDGYFEAADTRNDILITSGLPFMCLISNDGRLYVGKLQEDYQVTFRYIADGVTDASLCRGFCDADHVYDSGLGLAYRRTDGSIWYTLYLRSSGNLSWSSPTQVSELGTDTTGVQIIRLNDYRFGIYAKGANKLAVFNQNRIGNSLRYEYITPAARVDFGPIIGFRCESEDNLEPLKVDSFEFVKDSRGYITSVTIHFNYPIRNLDESFEVAPFTLQGTDTPLKGIQSDTTNKVWTFSFSNAPLYYNAVNIRAHSASRTVYNPTPQCTLLLPDVVFHCYEPIQAADIDARISIDNASLLVTGIVTSRRTLKSEYITASLGTDNASLMVGSVIDKNLSLNSETISAALSTATASLAVTQTGTSPT